MKEICYKKGLVYGIIILFIGAGFVPCISGDIDKTKIQSTVEIHTVLPLISNDYIDSYWRFNEGEGNIAYDSSGHEYDGTIHGASWTTDTPSGSGYALDFDGINDNIDLSSYATKLGFNKTDDLIISFSFKSSTNHKGMFYSMSTAYGTNPEFHIFLNANGTIGVKAEVLNCGFEFCTNLSYNNNVWHDVEVWYNGITNEPIVDIYVDDEPDGHIEHWVCDFTNNEFERTRIGRRSNNETDPFDGKIDEVKVIKYPGGNKQKPPVISGPEYGKTNKEYDFSFVTNDPEEDEIEIEIFWGTGDTTGWIGPYDSGEEVIESYKWNYNGTYIIKARSRDVWHFSAWSYHTIIIGNIPPYAPEITGPLYGEPGVEYEYTFKAIDNDGDDVRYFIDWGDGNTEWTNYYESGVGIDVSHAWELGDDYEITAKAEDDEGNEGDWSEPYPIRIGNEPPDAPEITGPSTGKPGIEYEFNFTTTDPEGDNIWYDIKWNDGDELIDYGPYLSGEKITFAHTWNDERVYTIKARARDELGSYGEWSEHRINIQQSRAINYNILNWLFERFPHVFPILRYLLGL